MPWSKKCYSDSMHVQLHTFVYIMKTRKTNNIKVNIQTTHGFQQPWEIPYMNTVIDPDCYGMITSLSRFRFIHVIGFITSETGVQYNIIIFHKRIL